MTAILTPAQVLLQAVQGIPKPKLKVRDPKKEPDAPDQVHRAIEVPREALVEALQEQDAIFAKLNDGQKKSQKAEIALIGRVLLSAQRRNKPTATLERATIDRLIAILRPDPLPVEEPDEETGDE